ncbi:hypothetical protein L1987_27345 [Smallanthus sonchifolius]|uniref:Uncharacterized protein n=1 Tax=Smallanthus sonchifolius TaxID=185202 RepID=A0ACB9ICF3_9ASTR|nr:hypothetical protein L1987_27345 [Smallanthus sonchifolius]
MIGLLALLLFCEELCSALELGLDTAVIFLLIFGIGLSKRIIAISMRRIGNASVQTVDDYRNKTRKLLQFVDMVEKLN